MYEMKESGIKWIGQIPKHWEVAKIKKYFINKKQIAGIKSSSYERLALTLHGVIKRSKEDSEGLQPTDFNTYQIIKKDDLIFKLIDLQNISTSRVGLSPYTGLVSPAYIRLECCNNISPYYSKYFFLMMWYNHIFNQLGDSGVRSSLGASDLMNLLIIIPPLDEQKKIADFLDKKVSEIENLIDDTKKLIEKYREYKQSIITETVTKGLNSNVEMKESGIEWIGQIPKHWKIKLVKELFYNVNNKNIGVKEKNLLSLSYGKIIQKDIYKNDGLVPANFNNYNIIKYDDIVLRLTDLQNDKKSLRVGHVREKGIITSAYITLRPISNYSTRYYYFLLHFYDICKYFYGLGSGVRQSLSFEEVKKILVLFPPLNEQEEIVKYLDDKCSQIDNIIEEKQLLLEKLEAYKKSLIYEYVTGKKQVENE